MACLQIYWELLSFATFLRVQSNSKEVSYLYWQNMYPNWKTTCYIKLKFFLWTKLLENLLLGKYLKSVSTTLSSCSSKMLINKTINHCNEIAELMTVGFIAKKHMVNFLNIKCHRWLFLKDTCKLIFSVEILHDLHDTLAWKKKQQFNAALKPTFEFHFGCV